MPPSTREFGKLADTSNLKPGDLLLSHSLARDPVSRLIEKLQLEGGYQHSDAQWTHAAMLVDERTLIEADLDRRFGGKVRETSLYDYCTGDYALLFRRPVLVTTEFERAKMLRTVYRRLGHPYAICTVCWNALRVFCGHRFYHSAPQPRGLSTSCSELYSSAYTQATGRTLLDDNASCPPAFLSSSPAFEDLPVHWLQIH